MDRDTDRGARRANPLLLGALAVVVIAVVIWKVAFAGDSADNTRTSSRAAAPSTPVAATASGAGGPGAPPAPAWAATMPRPTLTGTKDKDAATLDAREVAPARFAHQIKLVRRTLRPGEGILTLEIQTDGTLVALVGNGKAARYVATKKDLNPQQPPTGYGDALASYRPLTDADIDLHVPQKLLRLVRRAGGVTPGRLYLSHQAVTFAAQSGAFGDQPMWTIKWTLKVGMVIASSDGHQLKAVG